MTMLGISPSAIVALGLAAAAAAAETQYVLFNRAPGQGMHQARPETLGRAQFEEILARFPNRPSAPVQTGISWEGIRHSEPVLKAVDAFLRERAAGDAP